MIIILAIIVQLYHYKTLNTGLITGLLYIYIYIYI